MNTTLTEYLDKELKREPQAPKRNTEGAYMIMFYNSLDAEFGYDPGPVVYEANLVRAVAKAIARHLNKVTPEFVSYYVESEPERYW